MVKVGAGGACFFPLSWIWDPNTIIGFDFEYLAPVEKEAVQILDEYLGKFMVYHEFSRHVHLKSGRRE